MLALIIVLSCVLAFLLLILGLLLCPLKITVLYRDQVNLTLQYGLIKIPILPGKEKPEKEKKKKKEKPKKAKKPAEKKEDGKKKPGFLKSLKNKHGISGLLHLAKEILKIAGSTMKKFFVRFEIYHLHGDILLASGNAADTAVLYGKAVSILEPCVAVLMPLVPENKRKDVVLNVNPDFVSESSTINVYVQAGIRPWYVFGMVFSAIYQFIRVYMAANKAAKARQAEKAAEAAADTTETQTTQNS